MAQYPIRTLQLRILKILESVDRTCRKHHLRYYILCGTQLGAVRHKGFIPWDDDLDIGLPRPDYDLLMAHAHEWLEAPLEMVSYETDPRYPFPFGKIQDGSTTLIERKHINYTGGIYIDVFPLDGMTANPLLRRLHFAHYFFYKKLIYLLCRDPYKHGHNASSWFPLLVRKLFTLSAVQAKMQKLQKCYEWEQSEYIADHDEGLKSVVHKSVYGTPQPYTFEGITVMGVEKADEYLRHIYGDSYMVVPPVDQRHQHNFYSLDLDQSYHDCSTV